MADDLTENFNSLTVSGTTLSNGWFIQGATLGTQGSTAGNWGSYSYELVSRDADGTSTKCLVAAYGSQAGYVIIPTDVTGEISFSITGVKTSNGSYSIHPVTYDGTTYTVGAALTSGTVAKKSDSRASFGTWTIVNYTYTDHSMIALKFDKAAIDNFSAEIYEEVSGPALAVKDGSTKLTTGYAYNFGLATAGTTKTFTLSNPGTEDLGVSVAETGNFGATLSAATIAAGGDVTLTVTMPEATGSSAVTITPAAESGIDPFVINVSGTIRDANKVYLDFADGQMPEGWTSVGIGSYTGSSYAWTVSTGYIGTSASSSYYNQAFTSPKLTFAKDETVIFETARYASYYSPSVTVEYSLDGNTWTAIGSAFTDDVYGTWTPRSVTIPVEGVKYIRFNGWYVYLRNIYGGELPLEPNFKFTASDYAFGMISEAATTDSYTISNTGRADLTGVSVTSSNANFTISTVPTTIAAGENATFTVTMKADTKGVQNGTITVKADGFDAVTFNVSGYVLDGDAWTVTYAGAVPTGWVNTGWTFSGDYAQGGYTSSTTSRNAEMISPAITVAAEQTLAIQAMGTSTYAELKVYYSSNNGTTWTEAKTFNTEMRASTADYTVVVVDNIPAGDYKLKLEGYAVRVKTLNGYALNANAPELSIAAENFAAGKVTANASKTYTVTNAGTGKLTVDITSSSTDFTVSPAKLEDIEAGESADFTVTFNFDIESIGDKTATITVTPTYNVEEAVSFQATATAKDPNLWEEDFEDGQIPAFWTTTGWTVSQPASYSGGNGTYMAGPSSNSTATLITPRLQATKDQVLQYYVYAESERYFVKAEYSDDEQATWTEIATYTAAGDQTFTAPADGNYYIRFTGYYTYVDNFNGFKLNLPDHIATITASNIPASTSSNTTMKEGQSFDATVTVKESRGVAEALTAKLYMGDEVIGTATGTVAAKGTETLTITATPTTAATDGAQMHIEVEWAGTAMTTEEVTRYVAAITYLTLDETSSDAISAGTYDNVTLKRKFNAGWNTVCLPFTISDVEAFFGAGAKAYNFSSYADGALGFTAVTTLTASYPYVVYVPAAITEDIALTNITIASGDATAFYRYQSSVYFRGSYAPVAAGAWTKNAESDVIYGVTSAGKIQKAGANASIKGFRAYFDVPATEAAGIKALVFEDTTTGVKTVVAAEEIEGMFDLSGRRAGAAQKGVYIVNGKKVMVK